MLVLFCRRAGRVVLPELDTKAGHPEQRCGLLDLLGQTAVIQAKKEDLLAMASFSDCNYAARLLVSVHDVKVL